MADATLTTEDVQAVLVSKANIELQNISLRRQVTSLEQRVVVLEAENTMLMTPDKDAEKEVPQLPSENGNSAKEARKGR